MDTSEVGWFYLVGGKPNGPVPTSEMRQAIAQGELGKSVYVYREGLQTWQPAQNHPELVTIPPEPKDIAPVSEAPKQPLNQPPRIRVKTNGIERLFTLVELKEAISCNQVSLSDIGQKDGSSCWASLREMPDVVDAILPPLPGSHEKDTSIGQESAGITPGQTSGGSRANQSQAGCPSVIGPGAARLASRRSRLFAHLAETVMAVLFGAFGGATAVLFGVSTNTSVLGFSLLWLTVNSVLLANRGQTLGKLLFRIKVVDLRTGLPGGFRVVLLRYLLLWLLGGLCSGISWQIVFLLAYVADSLYIFSEDRRCLHDWLARTIVVSTERVGPAARSAGHL